MINHRDWKENSIILNNATIDISLVFLNKNIFKNIWEINVPEVNNVFEISKRFNLLSHRLLSIYVWNDVYIKNTIKKS